jgi:hypothetical protein
MVNALYDINRICLVVNPHKRENTEGGGSVPCQS